jgi:hypothetical protein
MEQPQDLSAKRNNALIQKISQITRHNGSIIFSFPCFCNNRNRVNKYTFVIIYAAINSTIGQFILSILAKNTNANVNTNVKVNQLSLHGTSYLNFINAIKSPATKAVYENSLKRYLNHIKQKGTDDLLLNIGNPRYIESQIIDYIMVLMESRVSYATMQFLVAPIFTFYQLNDVILNRKKVSRYLGEYKRILKYSFLLLRYSFLCHFRKATKIENKQMN